jgi:hypothetical protein
MNCTHTARLLPLYAGDDLDGRRALAVKSHLRSCPACRELAEEYAASGRWLRARAAPAFDDEFFADLRASVRREIARGDAPAGFWQRLALRRGWRPAPALVAALLLIVGGLLASSRLLLTLDPPPPPTLAEAPPPTADEGEGVGGREIKPGRAPRRRPRAAVSFAVALRESPPEQEPAAEPEMLRVEIQTADPSIRIIWLIPQDKALTESD